MDRLIRGGRALLLCLLCAFAKALDHVNYLLCDDDGVLVRPHREDLHIDALACVVSWGNEWTERVRQSWHSHYPRLHTQKIIQKTKASHNTTRIKTKRTKRPQLVDGRGTVHVGRHHQHLSSSEFWVYACVERRMNHLFSCASRPIQRDVPRPPHATLTHPLIFHFDPSSPSQTPPPSLRGSGSTAPAWPPPSSYPRPADPPAGSPSGACPPVRDLGCGVWVVG